MVPWAKQHSVSKKTILSFLLNIPVGAHCSPLLREGFAHLLFIATSGEFRGGLSCATSYCGEKSLVHFSYLWVGGSRARHNIAVAMNRALPDSWLAEAAAALGLGLHFKCCQQHRNPTDIYMLQKQCLRQGWVEKVSNILVHFCLFTRDLLQELQSSGDAACLQHLHNTAEQSPQELKYQYMPGHFVLTFVGVTDSTSEHCLSCLTL